jgi:hypothetical protein
VGHGALTFSAFELNLCRLRAVADIRQGAPIPDWNAALLTIARRLPAGAMRDLSCEGNHQGAHWSDESTANVCCSTEYVRHRTQELTH